VHLSGSYSALAGALSMSTKPALENVPSFVPAWLPKRGAQQNYFAYNFGLQMIPRNKNHPRSEYMSQKLSCGPNKLECGCFIIFGPFAVMIATMSK
jgi:hypothetical protein